MQGYIVRAGLVPGSAHKRKNFNNQDAYVLHEVQIGGTAYLFGAVFDGCTGGKGSRTEVGAVLLSRFFRSEIPLILSAHTPIQEVPATLYQRSVGYFGAIVRSTVTGDAEEMWTFVQNHLLCTVVGFITDGATLVVFSAGDGVIVHNENVIVIEQDDKPTYLGLHLIDRRMIPEGVVIPNSFDVITVPMNEVDRFAVATDGLSREQKADPSFNIDGIWLNERASKAGLQWWLNIGSNIDHRFSDDCAIIAFERTIPD